MTQTEFQNMYADCLRQAIAASPDKYRMPPEGANAQAEKTIGRMKASGPASVSFEGGGWKRMAKQLGVKPTMKDLASTWLSCEEV